MVISRVMAERINFKLAYNGVVRKFGSALANEKLFMALNAKVASIVKEESFELYWNDDDSNILLESCTDLNTAIDYAKMTRKNPDATPCVILTASSNSAEAKHNNKEVEEVVEDAAAAAPADPRPMIKQHLRDMFDSALECPWTRELRSAMKPLFCPRTKRLQKPSEICAAEIAVELAKLEMKIPEDVRELMKMIPINDLRKIMEVELLGRSETTAIEQASQSSDQNVVAATAVMLAVELALEQPWVEDDVTIEVDAPEKLEHLDGTQMCPEFQKQLKMGEYIEDPEIINQLRQEYDEEFDKVHTMICPDGKEIYVLTSDSPSVQDDQSQPEADEDDFSNDDDYLNEIDELEPDCWISKKATSILEMANERLDAAFGEVLFESPEEFLRKAKVDEIAPKATPPVVSPKEQLKRMRQRLRMINIAAPALPRSSLAEMERQIASLDMIEYEEHAEMRGKWPSVRTNIAAHIRRMAGGIPVEMVNQLKSLSACELARIVLLNCKDRLTVNEDSAWYPSTPQALLFVCAAAAIYPKEIRHAITTTIKKGTAAIDDKYEKKYGKDYVQKDKAARAALSLELAKYISYEKFCAFERLMLPPQPTKESETLLKHQKWASLIKSVNMTTEIRSFSTDDNAVFDEIAAKLFRCVRNFDSKTLGKWEQRGVTEYSADLYDEWMERVYKQLIWESKKRKETLVTVCSHAELAALLLIGAAAELSPSDMHIDLAEYNVLKSEEMNISEAARTFSELRETVANGGWADASVPASELIPWIDRLAEEILKKGQKMLGPGLDMLSMPEKEKAVEPESHSAERVLNPKDVLSAQPTVEPAQQQMKPLKPLQEETKQIVGAENPSKSENEMQPVEAPHLQVTQFNEQPQAIQQKECDDSAFMVTEVTASDESQPAVAPIQPTPHPKTTAEFEKRERELTIREKALRLKEDVFERYVAEFELKIKQFEEKYAELNQRVTAVDNNEDRSYFEETMNNMEKRLMKVEGKMPSSSFNDGDDLAIL